MEWVEWSGVGGGELFDHWSPWPCLKGLNLSWPYQGIFFLSEGDRVDIYQEWGCCGEIDGGVFPLEWRWRDVTSLQGMWKTCMHTHTKVCKSEAWKVIQAYLSECLTTGNHSPANFTANVYIGHAYLCPKNCRGGIFLQHTHAFNLLRVCCASSSKDWSTSQKYVLPWLILQILADVSDSRLAEIESTIVVNYKRCFVLFFSTRMSHFILKGLRPTSFKTVPHVFGDI